MDLCTLLPDLTHLDMQQCPNVDDVELSMILDNYVDKGADLTILNYYGERVY